MSPRPTADEMLALEAICQPGGSMASAAAELGVSILAIHKRLLRLYGRLDRADTSEMHGPTADVDRL